MKKFKQIDLTISCLLITGFIIAGLINRDTTFIIGYFVVGAWQVISMIVHAINKWFTERGSARFYYHWIVLSIFILTGLSFLVQTITIFIMYGMLFAAPFMALYYTWLCYREVYVKMQRPSVLFK